MNRFRMVMAGMALGLMVSAVMVQAGGPSEDPRPNILFIVSEDNGPELGCYGAPVKTPNLDKLAAEGTRFQLAFVTQAGCSQSRASFLTGTYPHQNGQIGLATWDYSMYRVNTPNLVNDLKNAGYRTGMIGKLHVNPESAFELGWWEIKGSNFKRKDLGDYAVEAYNFMMESNDPFYLQVNYPDAHDPFLPQVDGRPAKILKGDEVEPLPYFGVTNQELKQKTADYYNCMMRLDEYVGDLILKLKESGKYENTLVVYIGDHGADMLRGKRTCYEGGTRIPLIISWPGNGKKGMVYNGLVSTIDLYPTFMEITGNLVPRHLPGVSLAKVLKGDPEHVREYLFTEYHLHANFNPYPQRAVRNERYKLIHNLVWEYENPGYDFTIGKKIDPAGMEEALKKAPKNVVEAYERMKKAPEFELYDLEKDPYEWDNLAGKKKYREVFEEMTGALSAWQSETHDPLADKKLAEKLFLEIVNAEGKKIEIKYHDYMDPGPLTEE